MLSDDEQVSSCRPGYTYRWSQNEYGISDVFVKRMEMLGKGWLNLVSNDHDHYEQGVTNGDIFSFFGIIDFLSVVPSFLELFIPGVHYLTVLRILRVLRVFRVLKLVKYMEEATTITTALNKSRRKITVFLFAILTIVTILGSLIYVIEGEENGFTSIPRSVYWAIVTLTTVGYGDISPQTAFGQTLASIIMIMGYGMIAVPTGFVTAEISQALNKKTTKKCIKCGKITEVEEARYCKHCGIKLELTKSEN